MCSLQVSLSRSIPLTLPLLLATAMEAKEQTLIESLVELNLRHDGLQAEAVGMRGALAELRKLRGEHAMVLEMLGEKEERVVELEAMCQ